jgi:thioredoxin reductase
MRYDLPEVEGLAGLWGNRVFHCPYCHGWEVRDQLVAVYGCSDRAVHQALLLASLAEDIVLLCEDAAAVSSDQLAHLARAGIRVELRPVRRVAERDDAVHIALTDGSNLVRSAIFVQPSLTLATNLAASLGAGLTDAGTVATDATGLSTVPGLYVAGDAATPVQSVAVASASGARAAYAINAELATSLTPS